MSENMTDPGGYRRWLRRLGTGILLTAVGGAAVWLLWRPCLPFVLAYLLAFLLHRPHRWLLCRMQAHVHKKRSGAAVTRFGRGVTAVLLVLVCVAGGGGLLFWLGRLLWDAMAGLFVWLADNTAAVVGVIGTVSAWIASFLARVTAVLPIGDIGTAGAGALTQTVSAMISDLLGGVLGTVSAKASGAVTAFAMSLPRILLFAAVFVLASVYMTAEYDAISAFLHRALPPSVRRKWDTFRHGIGRAARAVIGAYCKMACLTFVLLLIGLLVLGVDGAPGIALIGAALDALPLIGVGAVLLPWALVSFFCGRIGRGVGLVVLYLVITVTRQALEPRIIGRSIGLHPLAALFALYAGGVLFGAVGMIAAPLCLSVSLCGYRAVKHEGR